MSLAADFILEAILIAILDLIVRKVLFCGTVLDDKFRVGLNWCSNKWRFETLTREDDPNCVVDALGVKADFLIS